MAEKIYKKLLPTILIFSLFLFSCGRRGPLIPRNSLVPSPPEIIKVIVSPEEGVVFLKAKIKKINNYKVKPIAVKLYAPGKEKIFYLVNLKFTKNIYKLPITSGVTFFRLTLLSNYGESPPTQWMYLPPLPHIPPPTIKKTTLLENGVQILWKSRKKVEGVILYIGNSPESLSPISFLSEKRRKILLTSLHLHKKYYIALQGVITCEKEFLCASEISRSISIYTKDIIPPPPPSSLSGIRKGGKILLFWNSVNVPDLLYYRIYKKNNFEDKWKFLSFTKGNRYMDRSCKKDENCYYTITAVDEDGNESPFSNSIKIGGEE